MVKYKFTPFCPHCGKQNFYVIESDHEFKRPELIQESKTCSHCHKTYWAKDILYPGKMTAESDESGMESQQRRIPILPTRMLMHGVPDTAPRHNTPFTWKWNEMLLDVTYTLEFEYQDREYEIFAPMSDDRTIIYLSEYVDLSRKMVDDYLDKIDAGGKTG